MIQGQGRRCPLGQEARGKNGRTGFSMVEILAVIMLVAVLVTIAWPAVAGAYGERVTRLAADQFTQTFDMARSAAIQHGRIAMLQIDEVDSRVWVEVDTATSGTFMDTIGLVRDFAEQDVVLTTTEDVLCFDPRGLPVTAAGCDGPSGTITLTNAGSTRTVAITATGIIQR